jgi:hypothetical protein
VRVDKTLGLKLVGAGLAVAIAAGFEFGNAYVFVVALVLFMAWLGFILLGPSDS